MDIFKVLTRGAAIKKNGKQVDFANIHTGRKEAQSGSRRGNTNETQLTKELDFFRNKKIMSNVKDKSNSREGADSEKKERAPSDEGEELTVPPPKIKNAEDAATLRKFHKANISGLDVPLPIGSFEDLISRFQLDKRLLNNLVENNFTEPTPIQCEAIPTSLAQRDFLACAPTGTGKTLAFLIPVLQQIIAEGESSSGVRALIISPTKELANQIHNECLKLSNRILLAKKRPLEVSLLSKSMAAKLKNKALNSKKYDIIISTPLRLIDLIQNGSLFLGNIKHLVFDEADKLFDKTFVLQTDEILSACSNPNLRKAMFSATIPSAVEELAHSIMLNPVRVIIGHKEAANSNIEQKLVFCGNEEGKLVAIRQLIQEGEFKPPVIIFLESVTRAKALFHELMYDKLNVDVIHAERTQLQRDTIIQRFKSGELWCLICTDVLARGVDFKGVNLVINYDVPRSAQAYVHRIGRTGRGGRSGKAITFFTKQDALTVKPIINVMKQSNCKVADWMEGISKLTKKEKEMIKKGVAFTARKHISTVPKVVKQKKRQRREMIEASKKRKSHNKDAPESSPAHE